VYWSSVQVCEEFLRVFIRSLWVFAIFFACIFGSCIYGSVRECTVTDCQANSGFIKTRITARAFVLQMYDVTRSYVWHDVYSHNVKPILCIVSVRRRECRDSLMCVTWLILVCHESTIWDVTTPSFKVHVPFRCVCVCVVWCVLICWCVCVCALTCFDPLHRYNSRPEPQTPNANPSNLNPNH